MSKIIKPLSIIDFSIGVCHQAFPFSFIIFPLPSIKYNYTHHSNYHLYKRRFLVRPFCFRTILLYIISCICSFQCKSSRFLSHSSYHFSSNPILIIKLLHICPYYHIQLFHILLFYCLSISHNIRIYLYLAIFHSHVGYLPYLIILCMSLH